MPRLCETVWVVSALVASAVGLQWLPEHARGGEMALVPGLLPPAASETSVALTLDVPLDHFAGPGGEARTFPLRYFVDKSCWDETSGPIFVQMGGEGPAGGVGCGTLERVHKAMAVAVEHRYYGGSIPFNDRSVANLKYLSVEQNLADTAAVVNFLQSNLTTKRAVMNFGGSYSGATAAWFRIKYPDVTHGTSSSSGVVNAILNFTGFDELIAAAVDRPTPGCAERIRAVTAAFEDAFAESDAAKNAAKTAMGASNLIGTQLGDDDFWYMIADGAAMMDQYGNKAKLCTALETPYAGGNKPTRQDLIANFAKTISSFWGASFGASCFYDSECLKNTTRLDMARSWRWQKCTELAYLQPGYRGSLRHEALSLDRLVAQCVYVFGANAIPDGCGVDVFDAKFGGANPKSTKIIFLDYSDDPWQMASVRKQLSPDLPYCFTECDGCGHCGAGVPSNLTKCRDMEATYIGKWLNEANAMLRSSAVSE